jgi:hypothetical protein
MSPAEQWKLIQPTGVGMIFCAVATTPPASPIFHREYLGMFVGPGNAPGAISRGASPRRACFSVRPAKTPSRRYASFCKGVAGGSDASESTLYVTGDIRLPLFVPDEALAMEGGAE